MLELTDDILQELDEAGPDGTAAICRIQNPLGPQFWILFGRVPGSDTVTCVADLGLGVAELGSVSLRELQEFREGFDVTLELDPEFADQGKPPEFFLE